MLLGSQALVECRLGAGGSSASDAAAHAASLASKGLQVSGVAFCGLFCLCITIIQPVALYNNRRYLLPCRLLPKCHFLIGTSSLSFFLHGLLLCAEVFGPSTLLTI
jgi:hypothetical protein